MARKIDLVIEICGSAGEGTISAGEILSRFMSSQGFEIMSFDTYPSEIRGFGKCVAHSRISNQKIFSPGKNADVLVALNDVHSISQLPFLKETGILIFDNKPLRYHEEDKSIAGWVEPGIISYGIPLHELAQRAAGSSRGRNMVALGAIASLFGINAKAFEESIIKRYSKKSRIVIDSNVNSFIEGYKWAKENITKINGISFESPGIKPSRKKREIINGNEAVARAAIDSGIHLFAGYPITPATKIMEILSKELPGRGGVVIQTEDEISAIGNVIGAGFAGKRAMTATSGPGFSLMTELGNLAIMAEVPAVIVNSQRGGPSTGLPTKTEQSDLNIAVKGGSGDSYRIVLAPTTVEECYECTCLALYLAEKYQTLVVLLLDFFLSNSIRNIDSPKKPAIKLLDANKAPGNRDLKSYKRYKITGTGISPRAIPGTPGGMFVSTGLEHSEEGLPRYDSETHEKMTEKRYMKIQKALKEIPKPKRSGCKKNIKVGVLAWGSTAGSAREAVAEAEKCGIRAAFMSPLSLSPLPVDEITEFANECEILLVPELNSSGQFADLIAPYVYKKIEKLNMVTGLPMPSEDILSKIKEIAE
ncbi:MAG: 2-oxoacid:acceptor oxidoreductase subunit alpha [Desulfobacterales bacterium]|nr:2-oxoacid:acceptor oxidoreductase subunit alpha [Desulfobacterales bacterium]